MHPRKARTHVLPFVSAVMLETLFEMVWSNGVQGPDHGPNVTVAAVRPFGARAASFSVAVIVPVVPPTHWPFGTHAEPPIRTLKVATIVVPVVARLMSLTKKVIPGEWHRVLRTRVVMPPPPAM